MEEISPSESQVLLTHFDWNLQRLAEVLKQEQNDYFKGAALQRFRHTYDIAIKAIRSISRRKNLSCQTDEQCFETALENGWLEKQLCWTEMIEDYKRINQKYRYFIKSDHRGLPSGATGSLDPYICGRWTYFLYVIEPC